MSHKVKIILFFVLFFAPVFASAADVSISEIMYDAPGTDTGHEWIEIYNSGSSVSLSGWKFFEEGSNHGLAEYQGGFTLGANSYAVIVSDPVKFLEDYPSFSGIILDSSWSSFNNAGESLAIKDNNNSVVFQVTYTGGGESAGIGNSLQFYSGSWTAGIPTPGAENTDEVFEGDNQDAEDQDDEENENESENNETQTVQVSSGGQKEELKKIYNGTIVKAQVDQNAVVGVPFKFKVNVFNQYGQELKVGVFKWNFGDGMTFQAKDVVEFSHIYKKAGKYVAFLDYFEKERNVTPDATLKIVVTVIEPGLKIQSIDQDKNIEIKNEGSTERDISGWMMFFGNQIFTLPPHTIVLAKSSIFINPLAHGFSGLNSNSKLDLYLPTNEFYATFPETVQVQKSFSSASSLGLVKSAVAEKQEAKDEISSDSQGASVVLAGDTKEGSGINPKIFIGAFILFCLIAMFVFYRFNKNKASTENNADDFKILS